MSYCDLVDVNSLMNPLHNRLEEITSNRFEGKLSFIKMRHTILASKYKLKL